jgi:hypothetical protein
MFGYSTTEALPVAGIPVIEQHVDDRITWTTPTEHSYTSHPHDYRPGPYSPPGDDPPPF